VLEANTVGGVFAPGYSIARSTHHHEEIHSENSASCKVISINTTDEMLGAKGRVPDSGVVFDTQVDMFCDTEAKVAGLGEVSLAEFVLLDLQPTLQDFLGLGSPDGDMAGNLFVPSDSKVTDSVTSLGGDRGLTSKLFQDL
jgi:hypothetical protein